MYNKSDIKCPMCRKFMPEGNFRKQILRQMSEMYTALFPYSNNLVNCQCHDCGTNYVFRESMGYYYCHQCKGFNVEGKEGNGTIQ